MATADSVPLVVPPDSSESLADAAPRAILAAIAAAANCRLDGVVLTVTPLVPDVDEETGVVNGEGEGAGRANDIWRDIDEEGVPGKSVPLPLVSTVTAAAAFLRADVRGDAKLLLLDVIEGTVCSISSATS